MSALLPPSPPARVGPGGRPQDAGASPAVGELAHRRDRPSIERERRLRRLLLDIGASCAGGDSAEDLVGVVLRRLVKGLGLHDGWVGLPAPVRGRHVDSTRGRVAASVAETLEGLVRLGDAPLGHVVRIPAPPRFEGTGGEVSGELLLLRFLAHGPEPAWLILAGAGGAPIPPDLDDVVASAAMFLGLAVSRRRGLTSLRRMNRRLEIQVVRRTRDLRREKETLEERVQRRTRDLENARRTALDGERRLLDLERREGVRQVAAGVAHELGSPLGALKATLDYVRDELGYASEGAGSQALDAEDLRTAIADALADVARMESLVAGLFGQAASARRAVVRTDLDATMRAALRHHQRSRPRAPAPEADLTSALLVGVPAAELTRWMVRLLEASSGRAGGSLRVVTLGSPHAPAIEITSTDPDVAAAWPTLQGLHEEIAAAGGQLSARPGARGLCLQVLLPMASGTICRAADAP